MNATKFLTAAMLLLLLAGGVHAQSKLPAIPEMTLKSDETALTLHNPTGREFLVVNIAVLWGDRDQQWTQFPRDLIIRANGDTRILYSSFVDHYRPKQKAGPPTSVAFILLTLDNRYLALNFEHENRNGFVRNDARSTELTRLYQSMPVQEAKDSRK